MSVAKANASNAAWTVRPSQNPSTPWSLKRFVSFTKRQPVAESSTSRSRLRHWLAPPLRRPSLGRTSKPLPMPISCWDSVLSGAASRKLDRRGYTCARKDSVGGSIFIARLDVESGQCAKRIQPTVPLLAAPGRSFSVLAAEGRDRWQTSRVPPRLGRPCASRVDRKAAWPRPYRPYQYKT
jgi:hypothetical protein